MKAVINQPSVKCICKIDLSNMGRASFDSHMKSKKHQTRIKEPNKTVSLFISWTQSTPSSSISSIESMSSASSSNSITSTPQQCTIVKYSAKAEAVSRAEIYWTVSKAEIYSYCMLRCIAYQI